MHHHDAGDLAMIFAILIIGCFICFLFGMILSGGKLLTDFVEEINGEAEKKREEEKEKYEKRMKLQGPSSREKYDEALRLYKQGHPMMCELLKRSKKEILQIVMQPNPKQIDTRVWRDMYRAGQVFGFSIPELSLFVGSTPSDPLYNKWKEQAQRELEERRRKIGISKIYDDPLALTDPHEPKDVLLKRGREVSKKYGFWENNRPNIFKSNNAWWEGKSKN